MHREIFAKTNSGMPLDVQDKDGNTQLHLAIYSDDIPAIHALLQLGASTDIRNKVGKTQFHLIGQNDKLRSLFCSFEPNMTDALQNGNYDRIKRFVEGWGNVFASINKGTGSIIAIASAFSSCSSEHSRCFHLLRDYASSSRLIHAVLSENEELVRSCLCSQKGNVNARIKVMFSQLDDIYGGASLLSMALQREHLRIVTLLLENGACAETRVPDFNKDSGSMPVLMATNSHNCLTFIIQRYHMQLLELDTATLQDGLTVIRRLINQGLVSGSDICQLVDLVWSIANTEQDEVFRIRIARELIKMHKLAAKLNRSEITMHLDKLMFNAVGNDPGNLLILMLVSYCGLYMETLCNEKGQSLREYAIQNGSPDQAEAFLRLDELEERGAALMLAACRNDKSTVSAYNSANYQDMMVDPVRSAHYSAPVHGFTALIRAIAHGNACTVNYLLTTRPVLKYLPDDNNRYPLHYAYALRPKDGDPIIDMLVSSNEIEDIQSRMIDKDGLIPLEYRQSARMSMEKRQEILQVAKEADPFGGALWKHSAVPESSMKSMVTPMSLVVH